MVWSANMDWTAERFEGRGIFAKAQGSCETNEKIGHGLLLLLFRVRGYLAY